MRPSDDSRVHRERPGPVRRLFQFWATTLQTWQAEYLAIAVHIVLTIFLRQQNSPESKPVEASNETTGKANR